MPKHLVPGFSALKRDTRALIRCPYNTSSDRHSGLKRGAKLARRSEQGCRRGSAAHHGISDRSSFSCRDMVETCVSTSAVFQNAIRLSFDDVRSLVLTAMCVGPHPRVAE